MPTNLVRTKAEERLWEEAKASCRASGLQQRDGSKFWACVVSRYQAKLKEQRGRG